MRKIFTFLHLKLGDLWWYSLLLFLASRSGDVIQAFIGLWLVPQYVSENELGAVVPLQQLCSFFAMPIVALATVFAKYVNLYATRGEFGKVKCFIRDTLVVSVLIFLVCILAAIFIMPHFYLRLKIASGLLTVLILISGFATSLAQLFTNALQGLKKFNSLTFFHFVSAPIRLVTLLVTMPIRALSGYVVGQSTPALFTSLCASFTLHRELRHVKLDTSWRRDWRAIARYFWPLLVYYSLNTFFASIAATIYRQRLIEVESAAYYILSRLAEIATYVGLSMSVVLFPLAAEAHAQGRDARASLIKTMWTITLSSLALAGIFALGSSEIFALTDAWQSARAYHSLLPILTLVMGISTLLGAVLTYEIACQRFLFANILLVFQFAWLSFLWLFTGTNFFRGFLPDAWLDWILATKFATLHNFTFAHLIFTALQLPLLPFFLRRHRH